MFYVYLLLSLKDNKFYIGFSEDVFQRLKNHNSGKVDSTKHRRPLDLIYYEAYKDKQDALGREQFLKSGPGHRYIKKQLRYFLEKNSAGILTVLPQPALNASGGVEQPGSSSGS